MPDRVETCKKCKQRFVVIDTGRGGWSPEPETIDCPHCGAQWGKEKTTGIFHTKPVDE